MAGAAADTRDAGDALSADAGWRWPVDASLGAAVLALVLLALGVAGLLRFAVVLAVTVVLGMVVWREVAAAARELGARLLPARPAPGAVPDPPSALVLKALLGALV
ncbi:MAG: hypothetical protein K1X31_10050, partial [Gemmatimonadaceae bacterium]|nr:hypothetical protein [Gemmatimonadaceae bacterium]